jgi:two-component sensor histidine kinase
MRGSLGPLRRRLTLVFAIALSVPAIFGVFAAIEQYTDQVRQAHETTVRYATLASSNEVNLLWQSQRIASDLARDPAVQASLAGTGTFLDCHTALKSAIDPYPPYAVAALLTLEGAPICRSNDDQNRGKASSRRWFQKVAETGKPALGSFTFAEALNEPVIVYGSPIVGQDGHLQAILALAIRLHWLVANGEEPGLPPDSSVDLLDKGGHSLIAADSSGHSNDSSLPDQKYIDQIVSSGARTFDAMDGNRTLRNYAVHPIGDNDLYVLFGQPTRRLVAPLQRDLAVQMVILSLFLIGGILAAIIGSRVLVTRWISRLTQEARLIASGENPAPQDFTGAPTEIRQLSNTLNTMAAQVRTREAELNESVAQKQMMLREIHHRVKNNLQTVTSLLNIYARIPRGEAIRQAFADVQTRINALALVHRHLYESQDLREIDMSAFMTALCRLVQDGSGVPSRRVRLHVSIPEVTLAGDRAVPLALLTTEVLTNAFKHAFPDHRTGNIDIKMIVNGEGDVALTITDDGIGPVANDATEPVSGMGQNLIAAFTRQLSGELTRSGPPGTTIILSFPLIPKPVEPIQEEG